MILLVTYNKLDYTIPLEVLQNAIQKNALSWWHHLDNTFIIRTNKSLNEFYNLLAPSITTNDRIFIVELKRNYQGWLNKEAWDWLNNEFKNDSFFGI